MTGLSDSRQPGASGPRATATDYLRLAFAFAMMAAAGQLLRVAYVHVVRNGFAWASRDALWMTPLAFLTIFLLVLLAQGAAGILVRPLGRPHWLAFTAMSLSAFSILLNFRGLHPVASLVLSLGTASVVAPWLYRAPGARPQRLLRVGMALAGAFVLLGVGERTVRALRDRQGAADKPAREGAPNVLLLIWDTVRASNTSLFGHERPTTPVLDRLAAEATVFDVAIAPSSWTLPSHAAMFTGHRAGSLGADWRTPYDGRFPTVAENFRASDYATSAFAANLSYTTWESGLNRGFNRFDDYSVTAKQVMWSANLMQIEMVRSLVRARSRRQILNALRDHQLRVAPEPRNDAVRAEDVVTNFLAWHRQHPGRPFFTFLNFFDAHPPIAPPAPYRTRFKDAPTDLDLYDGSIQYMDAQLGVLVDSLRARGALDRTILIVASDHGEQFGEHGLQGHGNSLYSELTRVPLLIRYPSRVRGGTRVTYPVSLTNLPATLVDLAGLRDVSFPGHSLFAKGSDTAVAQNAALTEVGPLDNRLRDSAPNARGAMQSVVDANWQYVRRHDGTEELFDYASDPGETSNLAADPTRQVELARLRVALEALLRTDVQHAHASAPVPKRHPASRP